MDWLELVRAMGALAITLGLIASLAWVARRYGLLDGARTPSGTSRRLKVVEQLWLDPGKSRMLIVRCDDREHLVLVGPSGASTIDTGPATPMSPGGTP
jgi:flagellar protein FliO/FliZ